MHEVTVATPSNRPASASWGLSSNRVFWGTWACLLALVAVISVLTIRISPVLWQDEAQIIEYGRVVGFEPDSTWSMNWTPADKPQPLITGAGAVLHELCFRLSGLSPLGPRLAALAGALIAATLFLVWLRKRATPPWLAVALAATLLVDPIMAQSYKGGRVDGLALSFVFAACLAWRCWPRFGSWAAGGLVAASVYVWPGAFLSAPLVAVEIMETVRLTRRQDGWRAASKPVLAFAIGLAGTATLLGALAWGIQARLLGSPLELIHSMYSAHAGKDVQYAPGTSIFTELFTTMRTSPLLWLSALACCWFRPARLVTLAAALSWAVVLSTVVYSFRVLYLTPFALVILATALSNGFAARWRRARLALVILPLLLGSVATLVLRPAVALAERDGRDPKIVFDLARKWIGPGPHLVYLEAWEFYYPGRQLGWHMYNPFGVEKSRRAEILARVDYAIVGVKTAEDIESTLRGVGWRVQATFSPASRAVMGVRVGPGLGAVPYGPYVLLRRQ